MGALNGDLIAWAFSNDGNFTLRLAYIAGLNALNPPTSHLSWIWKVQVPPKFLIFIWLCTYNGIPVRGVLGSRGLNLDQRCPIYNSGSKSINHLLHECSHSFIFGIDLALLLASSIRSIYLLQIGFTPTTPSNLLLGTIMFLGTFSSFLVFSPSSSTEIRWPCNSISLTPTY